MSEYGESVGSPGVIPFRPETENASMPNDGYVRRPRVIFVNRYFFPDTSATSQMLTDLARDLANFQYELHVICSRQLYDDSRAALPNEEIWKKIQIHRCWSARNGRDHLIRRSFDYLSFLGTAVAAMLKWTRSGDIVVAMTDPPMLSVCAALVTKWRGAVLINWLQDVFPEIASALKVSLPPGLGAILRVFRNWSLRQARWNVVIGKRMESFVTQQGVPAERQRVIENWADKAIEPQLAQRSALRRGLKAEGMFVVQYSGNLGRAHEFQTILAAMEELRLEPNWLFLFVGGGANMKRLQVEVAARNLANVLFLPYQPRETLGDSLAAADVHLACLLPALEGLIVPSKFYGILAAGRPIVLIGDPDGEQARVVRAEGCGSVVSCGDSATLVRELRQMRLNPSWLQDMGGRARSLYEDRYTIHAAILKWLDVLSLSTRTPNRGSSAKASVAEVNTAA